MKNPVLQILESNAASRCLWVIVTLGLALKVLLLLAGASADPLIYVDPR